MKKIQSLLVVWCLMAGMCTTNSLRAQKSNSPSANASGSTEVYYFHFTRRCTTCRAVETETQKALNTLYAAALKSGKITFRSVNLDEDASKAPAAKCKAEGQSLLIVSGNKRIDLTDVAFMYAGSKPEKLKEALKKAIDPLPH